jgi:hypothetical protein
LSIWSATKELRSVDRSGHCVDGSLRAIQYVVRKVFIVVIAITVAVLLSIAIVLSRSAPPVVELPSSVNILGQATSIAVHVRDPHGVRSLEAFVEQNGVQYRVWEATHPSGVTDGTLSFAAGTNTTPRLKDGTAKLIMIAVSNGLLRKTSRLERELMVVTRPPTISVDSDQHYLYLGMADLTTFNVTGTWTEAGVRVGDQTFRAWPTPGGKPGFFSLFAFAWNMPPATVPLVYASNGAGNGVTSPIVFQFPKREQPKYTVHNLQISDQFMQKVIGELEL